MMEMLIVFVMCCCGCDISGVETVRMCVRLCEVVCVTCVLSAWCILTLRATTVENG